MAAEISAVPTEVPVAKKKLFDTNKFELTFWTLTQEVYADVSALLPYKSNERNENMRGIPAVIVLETKLPLEALKLGEDGTTLKIEAFSIIGRKVLSSDHVWGDRSIKTSERETNLVLTAAIVSTFPLLWLCKTHGTSRFDTIPRCSLQSLDCHFQYWLLSR